MKLRILRAAGVSAGDAAALATALNEFYDLARDSEAELVSIIYVADFSVLITYSGPPVE